MSVLTSLQNCIQQQIELLQNFVSLLQRENSVLLADPQNQDLIDISTQKNDYARRISELDRSRTQNINILGFADDSSGINQLITLMPELQPLFASLWAVADQANQINNENGQLLNTYLEHNQKAINTLHGLMGQSLYDASGKFKNKIAKNR